MMIKGFYRHGVLADKQSMNVLAQKLKKGNVKTVNNCSYDWKMPLVESGLELADAVVSAEGTDRVLLVGHSQGGLVCRVAAVALVGECLQPGAGGGITELIQQWRQKKNIPKFGTGKQLGVVTIGTPNAGAMTYGQMSVATELVGRVVTKAVALLDVVANLEDVMTPRLFQEFEKWRVDARYLSISGVCVNRYNRAVVAKLLEVLPMKRVSVRLDVPNDQVVEDSSTDLRQSVIRPEVNLADNYRHVRAYPGSISLDHSGVRESPEVAQVIVNNLCWLVPVVEAA